MISFNSHCCLWLSKAAILINFAGSSIYIPSCSWWLQRRLSRIGLESMRKSYYWSWKCPVNIIWFIYIFFVRNPMMHEKGCFIFLGLLLGLAPERPSGKPGRWPFFMVGLLLYSAVFFKLFTSLQNQAMSQGAFWRKANFRQCAANPFGFQCIEGVLNNYN